MEYTAEKARKDAEVACFAPENDRICLFMDRIRDEAHRGHRRYWFVIDPSNDDLDLYWKIIDELQDAGYVVRMLHTRCVNSREPMLSVRVEW